MAFDAGMLACVLREIREKSLGARIEKVFQPEWDEIVLQIRSTEGGKRLLINAGSNNPRIGFTSEQKENPLTPPMLCMLLRKHLQGAKLTDVRQAGFERVAILEFETRDEMGFSAKRFLIAEIMGKYSNLIFTDGEQKVISSLRTVDFSTSSLRQVLPGMRYELPPKQDKQNPLEATPEQFASLLSGAPADRPADKWISSSFLGVSAAVAREAVHLASGRVDTPVGECDGTRLSDAFFGIIDRIRNGNFSPCMILRDGKPVEYAFCPLTQYGSGFETRNFEGAGEMLDAFFGSRDREQYLRQRASDILRILTGADTRIRRKLELQRAELAECEHGAEYKKYADLITANLYALKRGMTRAELTDWESVGEDGNYAVVAVTLDGRISPAANAQRYYKKYAKSKNAKVELTKQISIGEEELRYIDTVFDALTHAEGAADLSEIREELYRSGYASRMKNFTASRKPSVPAVARFRTGGGFRVLCGKNNVQNEYITHKLAGKNDYWFHVKNLPGSHTVLLCNGEEPSEQDFTEAAEIAAFYSKGSEGSRVEVDYTLARNVKKPAGSKPGFVIYHTNWSCVVTPDGEKIRAMREK